MQALLFPIFSLLYSITIRFYLGLLCLFQASVTDSGKFLEELPTYTVLV